MSQADLNGQRRKSLADQIDKLEMLLDGLADGLNEAIATAVRQALQTVLMEIMSRPELLAALQPATSATLAPSGLGVGGLLANAVPWVARQGQSLAHGVAGVVHYATGAARAPAKAVAEVCVGRARRVRQAVVTGWRRAIRVLSTAWLVTKMAQRIALPAGIALAVGVVAGVAAYYGGPWVGTSLAGISSSGVALALQVLLFQQHWSRVWPASDNADSGI